MRVTKSRGPLLQGSRHSFPSSHTPERFVFNQASAVACCPGVGFGIALLRVVTRLVPSDQNFEYRAALALWSSLAKNKLRNNFASALILGVTSPMINVKTLLTVRVSNSWARWIRHARCVILPVSTRCWRVITPPVSFLGVGLVADWRWVNLRDIRLRFSLRYTLWYIACASKSVR
jgi:hypothetical protein